MKKTKTDKIIIREKYTSAFYVLRIVQTLVNLTTIGLKEVNNF
jgi:hypothetical protein